MREDNPVKLKSEAFALRIFNLYKFLSQNKGEYIISKQILRSGTSIGANVTEALCGISRKDFLAKMYIAFKECVETQYWLTLLYKTELITAYGYFSLNKDCEELRKILSSITKSTSQNLNS